MNKIGMRFRVFSCVSWVLLVPLVSCSAQEGDVRRPAVAGAFYPGSSDELAAVVDSYLAQAAVPAIEGRIRALVVPHAGYIYSGQVAAYGFKAVAGQSYKTVVLIGNSHQAGFDGAAVYPAGKFVTPLGAVEIDADLAQKLMASSGKFGAQENIHGREHSLEVELPFLQKTLGTFKLVPILLGAETMELAQAVGEALAKNCDADTLVIASTDLSHYPAYKDAQFADGKTVEAVLSGSADNLERTIRQTERMGLDNEKTCMCGEGAVKSVMIYAERVGAKKIQLLKYANSGDTAGSKDSVVGYAAISFAATEEKQMKQDKELSKDEQQELLKLARNTVETFIKTGKRPEYVNKFPTLEEHWGAFVTLHERGQLRGCIGRFQPDIPLYEVVQEMAIAAATQDFRFPTVTEKDLKDIDYEISVLSPLRKINDWHEIQLGKHGVQVVSGFRSGVFLPQVATETGWDLDTFMGELCSQKAGLAWDAWKDPKTTLYVFTAQVFSEKE